MKHVWQLRPGFVQHSAAGSWCSRQSSAVVEGSEGMIPMQRIEAERMIVVVAVAVVVVGLVEGHLL